MKLTFMLKGYTMRKEDSGHVMVIDERDAEDGFALHEDSEGIGIEIFSWCDKAKHGKLSKLVGDDVSRLKHRQRFNGKKLHVTIESLEE